MNLELKSIDKRINDLRESLYILLTNNDITNDVVVNCSQKLDKLILEYQKLVS
ncbi:aspartyl-phosphate phosphatase Spo0E family protein [Clostridium sp. JN-1]|jgi:hypothetical protein|uniref:aspartyl-phosphate phosphatase Spo0E family protein n=1 Tax=Clostridium sp. JN-1 TaxID=2483110 RepID=UPI000F0B2C03|nr:aspartyl-phosphate phosphatase Spo0E family protein [Clostridium sp. JN-1]